MHTLRWPQIHDFIATRRAADAARLGARTSPVWQEILESFRDD